MGFGHAAWTQDLQQHGKRHVGGSQSQGEQADNLGLTQTAKQKECTHGHDEQGAWQYLKTGKEQGLGGVQMSILGEAANILAQCFDLVSQSPSLPAQYYAEYHHGDHQKQHGQGFAAPFIGVEIDTGCCQLGHNA